MKSTNILKRLKSSWKKPDQKIFFLHIPKCGGRSIEKCIGNLYKTINPRNDWNISRQDSLRNARMANLFHNYNYEKGDADDYQLHRYGQEHLAYLMFDQQNKFISGHTPFNENIFKAFSDTYCFITVLRDPVAKWISNYYYRKYRDNDHWRVDETMKDYLQSDRGRSHGYDYVKYIGGLREDKNYISPEAIETAKLNLHKFHIVDCLEQLPRFTDTFQKKIGFKLHMCKKNTSPSNDRSEVTPQRIEQIKNICKPDLEIYQYAKDNLWK